MGSRFCALGTDKKIYINSTNSQTNKPGLTRLFRATYGRLMIYLIVWHLSLQCIGSIACHCSGNKILWQLFSRKRAKSLVVAIAKQETESLENKQQEKNRGSLHVILFTVLYFSVRSQKRLRSCVTEGHLGFTCIESCLGWVKCT